VTGSLSSASVNNTVPPSVLASITTVSGTNSANVVNAASKSSTPGGCWDMPKSQLSSQQGKQSKQSGSCPVCFRHMSITSAGVIHKHGLPSNPCAGSGCVPIRTVTTSVSSSNQSTTSSASGVSASTNNQQNTQASSSPNSTNILDILRSHRCRVLKRVPKASRIPAADKLTDTAPCRIRSG